jgi:hypothetical protein
MARRQKQVETTKMKISIGDLGKEPQGLEPRRKGLRAVGPRNPPTSI